MKKLSCFAILLALCTFMCSCGSKSNDGNDEWYSFVSQAKKDARSAFSAENYNYAQVKFEDDGYYYLREKVDFSFLYAGTNIISGTIDSIDSSGETIYLYAIDENGNFYHRRDSADTKNGEIGIYFTGQKVYKKLMTIPLGSQVGIEAVNADYIVWEESMDNSEWWKTRLHLYKQKDNVDTVIYERSINPKTGFVYGYNWNEIIIIDDKIYFDDIVGEESGILQISIFCYDIKTGAVTEIQKQGKGLMRYTDKIAWNEMGKTPDDISIVAYDGKKKETVVEFKSTDTMTMANAGGKSIAYIDWLYTPRIPILHSLSGDEEIDDYEGNDCMGLQIWNDGSVLPVIISKSCSYLSKPQTNGRVFIFGGSDYGTRPVFYDIKYDRLVVMDELPSGYIYAGLLNNNILVFYFTIRDSDGNADEHHYYLVKLDG